MLGWGNRPREVKKLAPYYTASRSDFNAHILITAPQCLSLGLCIAPTSTFLPFLLAILPLPIPKHWSFYFGSNFAYIHPLCNLMYRQSFHLPCTQMVSKSKYQAQISLLIPNLHAQLATQVTWKGNRLSSLTCAIQRASATSSDLGLLFSPVLFHEKKFFQQEISSFPFLNTHLVPAHRGASRGNSLSKLCLDSQD